MESWMSDLNFQRSSASTRIAIPPRQQSWKKFWRGCFPDLQSLLSVMY